MKYRKGDSVATALSRHGDDSSVNVTPHGVAPSSLHVCLEFPAAFLPSSELANKASYRQLWGLLLQPPVGSWCSSSSFSLSMHVINEKDSPSKLRRHVWVPITRCLITVIRKHLKYLPSSERGPGRGSNPLWVLSGWSFHMQGFRGQWTELESSTSSVERENP